MSVNYLDLKHQLAKLDGNPPYNTLSNVVANNPHFARSIEEEFGYSIGHLRTMLREYEENLNKEDSVPPTVIKIKEDLEFSDLIPKERALLEEMVTLSPTIKIVTRSYGHGADYEEEKSESVMEVSDYHARYQSALNRIQAQREIFGIDDKETVSGKIQTLRFHTGSSLEDVRKALDENGWDYWFAYQQLRKKGLA